LNLTLMEPAVALAVLAWLIQAARARTLRIWPAALLAAQILLLALFLISSLGAEERGPSLKDTLKWIELVLIFTLTVDQVPGARLPGALGAGDDRAASGRRTAQFLPRRLAGRGLRSGGDAGGCQCALAPLVGAAGRRYPAPHRRRRPGSATRFDRRTDQRG